MAGESKPEQVQALGADRVIAGGKSIVEALGRDSVDIVIDVAEAIAGPIVKLDERTLCLKDLTFLGCTFEDDIVFENLVAYIERGEIKPAVSKIHPMSERVKAQRDLPSRGFAGKLMLVPPQGDQSEEQS